MFRPHAILSPVRVAAVTFLLASGASFGQEWAPLWNGTDLTGIKTVGEGKAEVKAGELVGSGDCCGYFGPEKVLSHYRMKADFKLGNGNSGFAFHLDKWIDGCRLPSGIEININGGDQGTVWWTDAGFKSFGSTFTEGGAVVSKGGTFGCKDHASYKSSVSATKGFTAWNSLEVFVKGDSMEAKLNDKVFMRIFNLETAKGVKAVGGKVGFLIEGSSMSVKSWMVQDLAGGVFVAPKASLARLTAAPKLTVDYKSGRVVLERSDAFGARHFDVSGHRILPTP